MQNKKRGVILIGHGGLPSDIPKEIIEDFMKVHKQRIRTGTPITAKEKELDNVIRFWTRSPATDPYKYCLLYTSPSPRDATLSRMPSSA